MQDTTGIGIVSGLIASLVYSMVQMVLFYSGAMNHTIIHIWSQIVMPQADFTTIALIIGFIGHIFTGIFFGVIITYHLRQAGTDYLWLKGVVWGGILWIIRIGLVNNIFMRQKILSPDSTVAFWELASHLAFGSIVAYSTAYLFNKNIKTGA